MIGGLFYASPGWQASVTAAAIDQPGRIPVMRLASTALVRRMPRLLFCGRYLPGTLRVALQLHECDAGVSSGVNPMPSHFSVGNSWLWRARNF